MRLKVHITILFALGLATIGTAQETKDSFFRNQAVKDAHYEQSYTFANLEDEKDFWHDQHQYEKDLATKNIKAYSVYMRGKKAAYREYEKLCGDQCKHSKYFHDRSRVYISYTEDQFPLKEITSSVVQITSPRI